MTNFYTTSDDMAILRERIEELARIRQDYAASLGSSLFAVTKDNDSLRWGRESLYNGIANCDEERDALLQRIAELDEPWKYVVKEEDPEDTFVPMPIPEVEDSIAVFGDIDSDSGVVPESESEIEPEVEVEQTVEVEQEVAAEIAAETEFGYDSELVEPESAFEFDLESEFDTDPEPEVKTAVPSEPESLSTLDTSSTDDTTSISLGQTAVTPSVPTAPTAPEGIVCPTCGTVAAPSQRFCMECGTQLPTPRANVCPHCGSPTEPSFRFCMECGYKLV